MHRPASRNGSARQGGWPKRRDSARRPSPCCCHAKSTRNPRGGPRHRRSDVRRGRWRRPPRVRDVTSPRNRTVVVVGLGCGLRQGEVFAMRPCEDIDHARGVLRIRRPIQGIGARLYSPRHREPRPYRWHAPAVAKELAAQKEGFQVLRHTHAQIMVQTGESVVTLACRLGHHPRRRSPSVTMLTSCPRPETRGERPLTDCWGDRESCLPVDPPDSPQSPLTGGSRCGAPPRLILHCKAEETDGLGKC